jgi:hypothetical protein
MSALRDFGTLLRLVFGTATAAVAEYLDALAPGASPAGGARGRSGEEAATRAALAASRCRQAITVARAERARLVADILRYDQAREVLIAQEASEADVARKEALRRSLKRLEDQLTAWLDASDALGTEIAGLETDLAFFEAAAAGGTSQTDAAGAQGGTKAGSSGAQGAAPAFSPETAHHLGALGLTTMPASLAELKSAYRARLKAVHPDVGAQPSTHDAARATVAFAELRRGFPQP